MSTFTNAFVPSRRLEGLSVSDIVQIKQRAATLAHAGRDIIDLSIGEPDFHTPSHIRAAAHAAIERGDTHYTSTAGTLELREAIVRKLARDNRRAVTTNEVMVGVGAKQVIANALLASLEPDDEVIIPTPFWSNYPDMVQFAGGKPVFVRTEADDRFLMQPAQLAHAITPRTKWLLLNSPSNPTGACYDHGQLRALAEVLAAHRHVGVIEDAIYEHIMFDGEVYGSILDAMPALADRTLWVNGVSKAYAMTGWRVGFGVGPKALIDAMIVVSAQTTSHPCSIAQAASAAALDGDGVELQSFRETFERRRGIVCEGLGDIPGLSIVRPGGAFYAFPDVRELLAARGLAAADDRGLVASLLEEAGVALVPGSSFGAPGHFRLSFAASDDRLGRACARIAAFLSPRRRRSPASI